MDTEIPLEGGRVTEGVVRIDNTVRRPTNSNSPFVHELLGYLDSINFPHSPRFHGIDTRGREILEFVEGEVPANLGYFSSAQLTVAAKIIASFHSATAGHRLAGSEEVIIHGDLSPCNFVFALGEPTHIIDYDSAAPGSRKFDIGYAAWTWLNLGDLNLDPKSAGRRLAIFLSAYGGHSPSDPIGAILDAQDRIRTRSCEGDTPRIAKRIVAWASNSKAWVMRNRQALEQGFGGGAA